MKIQQWVACITVGILLTHSKLGIAQITESQCIVRLFDRSDYRGQISVHWSPNMATTFDLQGTDKWAVSPVIPLPAEIKDFEIKGSLAWKHYRKGNQRSSGSSKCSFVDFTPVMRPLRSEESWGKRMDQFVKELDRLEKLHADREETPSQWLESKGPVPPSELIAAEQRLKFGLPKEHKQMLQEFGAWSFSDSFCVSASDMDSAEKQMRSIWGSPASEFNSLSAKNKELYRTSVMLYVEVGDGYGALLFHPTTSGGDYYWIHQDDLDRPEKLLDSQGKPRDYSSTMRWLMANQILFNYEDALPELIFMDRSTPTPLPYQLQIDFPTPGQLTARLDVDWKLFE